jgi:Rrf2 family protein
VLNKKTKYALNALLVMARKYPEGHLSAAAIAAATKVPPKFLEAILAELGQRGFILSKKGRGGGHRLRRAPRDVNMAEIVRLFDGAIGLVPCVTHNYYVRCEECQDEATCGIRDVFLHLRQVTLESMRAATLADLMEREDNALRKAKRRAKGPQASKGRPRKA